MIKDPNFMARLRGALANEFGVRTALNNPLIIDAKFHADIQGLAMCELKSARATDFDRLWRLVDSLKINSNKARLVPNTKMLAHVLTELVVPVDRTHTQRPSCLGLLESSTTERPKRRSSMLPSGPFKESRKPSTLGALWRQTVGIRLHPKSSTMRSSVSLRARAPC